MDASVADALSVLPASYLALAERAAKVLEADDRVRACWLHGSTAKGMADITSDLDLIVAVRDEDLPGFAAGWRERLAEITPTVMARASFGGTGSWLSVTDEALRLDLWVEPAGGVATSPALDRLVVFDRDGLDVLVPPSPPPAPPSQATLDFYRGWAGALAGALAAGAGPLLQAEILDTARFLLYQAMVETNRPLPPYGLKQWSVKLTAEQAARFRTLPTTGDAAPVLDALAEVVGPIEPVDAPVSSCFFSPPGMVRGLALEPLPPAERLLALAEELFALSLYLPVTLHRQDWLLGVVGLAQHRRLVYELCLEEQGRPPLATAADWDARLTTEQTDLLLGLPCGPPERDALVDGFAAVHAAFVSRARPRLGDAWPAELERVVSEHVAAAVAATA